MTQDRLEQLLVIVHEEWRSAAEQWPRMPFVVFYDEMNAVLSRAAFRWAGIPVTHPTDPTLPTVRTLPTRPADPTDKAAVVSAELVVAAAPSITCAALALHEHPQARVRLPGPGETYLDYFVREVRRFYQPELAGAAPAHNWPDPQVFRPERFSAWDGPRRDGGEPGGTSGPADIVSAVMKAAVWELLRLRYDVPPQDLSLDRAGGATLPASRFVITKVERRHARRVAGVPANIHTQNVA